jgi:hypothetical protein
MVRRACWTAIVAATALGTAVLAADVPLLSESRAITKAFGARLQTALKESLAEGGPTAAISVCRDVAPLIASDLSRESGAKVARTSLRFRNPANAPEPWQEKVLHEFDAQSTSSAPDQAFEYFEPNAGTTTRYMKAINTSQICLICHGSALSDSVRTTLNEHYPFDRARGYELGDVRGAISITWPDANATQ